MAINESYGYGIVNNSEMFGKWKFKNDDLIFEPRGRAIHIKDIIINIEDKSYTLLLTFNTFINEEVDYSLKLEDFNRVGLLQLAKYGADVTENNISTLINVLQNERNDFETDSEYVRKYTHTHLGWDMYNKQHIFKAYLTISNIENFKSKYSGNYYLKPKGKLSSWRKFIKDKILGNTPLELAVIIGLSGVVNAYIGRQLDCDNLLVHLVGESTTGKTTAGILALSTSSVPMANVDNKETHMRTWNSTKNALLQSLNGNHGFPVLFDEFSMNKDYSITDLIYSLIYGKDKSRLNGDSEQKFTNDFRTTIISTGEASMLNKTTKNTGLLVRLIEFSNIKWTTSSNQATDIKKFCRNNYGLAIYKVAKYLLSTPVDEIEEIFYNEKKLYLENTTIKNEFSERIAKKYAMLLLTLKVVSKALKLDFNHDAILQLLLDNERDTINETPSHVGERAYNSLLEYILSNENHFVINAKEPTIDIYGEIKSNEIVIPKEKFAQIMKSIGFEDVKTIIQNWKNSNLLNFEEGRNTRTRKLTKNSSAIPCYVIKKKPEDTYNKFNEESIKSLRYKYKLKELKEEDLDEILNSDND